MNRLRLALAPAAATAATLAATAAASAPPVGPLPKGPVTTIDTARGSLVAVALPRAPEGRVWRLARTVDPRLVRQTSEADVGTSVVVVFRTVGSGDARIVFAQTRGESGTKALRAATWLVHVR